MNICKKAWVSIGGAMILIAALGCAFTGANFSENVDNQIIKTSTKSTVDERANEIVAAMSDAEKVGQLLVIGIHGTSINDDIKYMLGEYHFGGIVLFDRNMQTKDQVRQLLSDLQSYTKKNNKIGLFLAVDQEGGIVARMKDSLVNVPSAQHLGAEDVLIAENYARQASYELADLGFNLNFAPVVDLGLTYGRSFSQHDPEQVVKYAGAVAKAYENNGLQFSFKHFPGIGKADVDLHEEGNTINVSKDVLLEEDIKPYRDLIPQFSETSYMVMVSHAKYPAFDKDNPASLSFSVMNLLLRKELGFQGVIVTDDMEMGAVANHYTFGEMAIKTVQSGADIVLICHEYAHMIEAYNALLNAVRDGRITRDQLDTSVKRIVKMKLENKVLMQS